MKTRIKFQSSANTFSLCPKRLRLRATRFFLTAFSVLLVFLSWTGSASAQCGSDLDCKGERICQAGRCADLAACTRDTDCPGDAICNGGQCKLAQAVTPVAAQPVPNMASRVQYIGQPKGDQSTKEGIKGLMIAGPIVLGASYLTTISVTSSISSNGRAIGYSAIPVFGPWVMIGSDLNTDDYTGALVASGLVQATGLTMLILGVSIRSEVKVPRTALAGGSERATLSLTPVAGPQQTGLVGKMTW